MGESKPKLIINSKIQRIEIHIGDEVYPLEESLIRNISLVYLSDFNSEIIREVMDGTSIGFTKFIALGKTGIDISVRPGPYKEDEQRLSES